MPQTGSFTKFVTNHFATRSALVRGLARCGTAASSRASSAPYPDRAGPEGQPAQSNHHSGPGQNCVPRVQTATRENFGGWCINQLVPVAGLEPARIAASDFESDVSTIPPHGHCSDLLQSVARFDKGYRRSGAVKSGAGWVDLLALSSPVQPAHVQDLPYRRKRRWVHGVVDGFG